MCNHSYAKGRKKTSCAVMCMRIRGQLNDVTSEPFNKHNVTQSEYYDIQNYVRIAHVFLIHSFTVILRSGCISS